MSQAMAQLIINLLDSNTVDSIILAKLLYGKITKTEILIGRRDYHFVLTLHSPRKERIYAFNRQYYHPFGDIIYAENVAYPYYE